MTAGDIALITIGVVFLATAAVNAPNSPNASYLIGTFLPGLFFLILGLKGRITEDQDQKNPPAKEEDSTDDKS